VGADPPLKRGRPSWRGKGGSHLAKGHKPKANAGKALEVLVAALERGIDALEGREADIRHAITDFVRALQTLRRFEPLAKKLKRILSSELDRDEPQEATAFPMPDEAH
jgi:hypothetical protein